jgi:ATP-dependent Clp protease ATP-binding subunit ClpE
LESRINDVLKETFRPEFLNRIDEIVIFTELGKEELKKIVELMLGEVREELAEKGMGLEVTEPAKEWFVEKGYDSKFGARPLRRLIQKHIEDELSEAYLKGRHSSGDTILVDCVDDEIVIR